MSQSSRRRFITRLAVACLALSSLFERPATAIPALAYGRDAAEFLKAYHADLAPTNRLFIARKYALMSDSAIGFFRGSAPLFYRDLSEHPKLKTPIAIRLMGDLHLENASAYRTTNGAFAFDLDDFDEACVGPYSWELARVLVSLRLHLREANLSPAATERLVRRLLKGYLDRLAGYSQSPASLNAPVTAGQVPGPAAEAIAAASRGSRARQLAEWAPAGELKTGKKQRPLDRATHQALAQAVREYAAGRAEGEAFFRVKDAVRRVAGLASLTRQRFLVLVEGPTRRASDDVLLDLKEQRAAAGTPWLPAGHGGSAERVRQAWRYFVPDADALLGTLSMRGVSFLVKEFSPFRGEVEVDELNSEARFGQYVDTVALLVARAHARSGQGTAILQDSGGLDELVKRLSDFTAAYAIQVEADREIWKTYMDP
ncbi:MAG: DUF2252 family protein [Candidatus Sericytochromatia bacterium]|nr:DUF2252 family protein [Candidatus Sericytochromatia bacterium]